MIELFRWRPGRQGSGYDKMLLFRSHRLLCDLWLLRYRAGAWIPEHTDPVPGHRHYRANLTIKRAIVGGEFYANAPLLVNRPRLKVFRSDQPHGVMRVLAGTRWVISAGWLRPERSEA